MKIDEVLWDLEDDVEGNYWHIVVEGHGVTQEEVDEVLLNPANPTRISRSSGRLITFGWTSLGQHLAVLWEEALEDPRTAYPVTAYPAPPQGGP
jgi:hypothetical protein